MKKVILFTAAIISFSNFAFAQAANTKTNATQSATAQMTPDQRAKAMTDKMQGKLNLTASQHESMYKVNLEFATRMTNARNNRDKAAAQDARNYRTEQYKKILTSQQMTIVEQQMAEKRNGTQTK